MRLGVKSVGGPHPIAATAATMAMNPRRIRPSFIDYAAGRCRCQGGGDRLPRIMRIAWLLALAMLAGCTRATAIGTPCVVDKDCNVKGQRCVSADGAKICTHACTAQAGASGCPIGYDCTPADATHASDLTCNKERYAFDPV